MHLLYYIVLRVGYDVALIRQEPRERALETPVKIPELGPWFERTLSAAVQFL